MSVSCFDRLLVYSPNLFLDANDNRLTQQDFYPLFGSALYDAYEKQCGGFHHLPIRRVEGECIVFQNWGPSVWGHVLLFMIPRLFQAQKAGIVLSESKVLISSRTPAWQKKLLHELFGISKNLVLFNPDIERVQIDHAVVPHIPYDHFKGFTGEARGIFLQLKESVFSQPAFVPRKEAAVIMIDRRGYRNPDSRHRSVKNFECVIKAVSSVYPGVNVVEPSSLSFRDQVLLFDSASIVIGEYGSALHNSVFCRRGVNVLSLGESNDIQAKICALMDQNYSFIPADTLGDVEISIDKLLSVLCKSALSN